MQIRLVLSSDLGPDLTEAEYLRYQDAVRSDICDKYPTAEVDIQTKCVDRKRAYVTLRVDGEIQTSLEAAERVESIEEAVLLISRDVWDHGFWA